jgi:hypothetical protein
MTTTVTDPFAGGTSTPSLSFKDAPVGTSFTCTVVEAPTLLQSRNFETGNPDFWPDGNPKMSAVVKVTVNGEERSIWAAKPSAMFAAIASAQQTAGQQITPGGTLVVTYTHDKPNENPRLNAAKQYSVVYTPPNAFGTEAQEIPADVQQARPAQAATPAATGGPSPEQVAALKAAGVDPATVFPGYTG